MHEFIEGQFTGVDLIDWHNLSTCPRFSLSERIVPADRYPDATKTG
jgi:hypothetical protein